MSLKHFYLLIVIIHDL